MARTYGRGLVTGRARAAVFERFGFACAHCAKQFPKPENYSGRYTVSVPYRDKRGKERVCMLEVDHIVPRLHGGTNDPANLQALCTQCNSRKGARV